MFYLSIFGDYFKNYVKTKLAYRTDFLIELLSDLLFQGTNLLAILVIFEHIQALEGYSREEIIFIYGFFMVPYGVFGCFFNLWGFTERYIVKGEMDRVLTRPAHNLVQLILENLDPSSLFGAVVGGILMAVTGTGLGLELHWWDPLALMVFVLGAAMIYIGIYVSLTAISFFSDAPTGILPLMWNIQSYGRNPVGIYNRIIRFTLTWILPFAFVGFYPADYFLGKEGAWKMAMLTPVVGIVFFSLGLFFWNFGVRRYRGAGS